MRVGGFSSLSDSNLAPFFGIIPSIAAINDGLSIAELCLGEELNAVALFGATKLAGVYI